jgi:predicted DNA-binding transcriptional regulator YafY
VLRVTARQADRLRQDWYYGQALFDPERNGSVRITFGEDDQAKAFELLRWLGPGAELIEPTAWRSALRAELAEMVAMYQDPG